MRRIVLLAALIVFTAACKESAEAKPDKVEPSTEDGLVTMRGAFIYMDDAAVLQTANTIYGVVIDDMAEKLQKEVAPLKQKDTDMITVTLRAKRIPKPEGEEGWPVRIEIKDILKIEQPEQGAQEVIELSK